MLDFPRLDFPKVYTGPSLVNKVPQRKLSQVAFRGDNEDATKPAENKPEDKPKVDDFAKVTFLKRVGKFFKDIGHAFKTLFSNKWAWQFDALRGQEAKQLNELAKDKDAEKVVSDVFDQVKGSLAKTIEKAKQETPQAEQNEAWKQDLAEDEEQLKKWNERQKDGALLKGVFIDNLVLGNQAFSKEKSKSLATAIGSEQYFKNMINR